MHPMRESQPTCVPRKILGKGRKPFCHAYFTRFALHERISFHTRTNLHATRLFPDSASAESPWRIVPQGAGARAPSLLNPPVASKDRLRLRLRILAALAAELDYRQSSIVNRQWVDPPPPC